MTKSSQIYISDNRNIIPVIQELKDKVDALPDNELLLHFQTEYDDFIGHKDNFLRKNTDEEINATFTFKKYPLLPDETPSNNNPISLDYFNNRMSNFVSRNTHEIITGAWEFTAPIKGVEGTDDFDYIIKKQIPTLDGDKTISGKWKFENPVEGSEAQQDNQLATLAQVKNVELKPNSKIKTPIFIGETPPTYKKDSTTEEELLITTSGLYDRLGTLTELPTLTEYIEPSYYQLVQKHYVDKQIADREFKPSDVPYLTSDNLFSKTNTFNDNANFKKARQLGEYKDNSFIFEDPQTTKEGTTAFSDYVNINYLDKKYAKKESAPFLLDGDGKTITNTVIDFKNGLKVKGDDYAALSSTDKALLAVLSIGGGLVSGGFLAYGLTLSMLTDFYVNQYQYNKSPSYVEFKYDPQKLDEPKGMIASVLKGIPIPLASAQNAYYHYLPLCTRVGKINTSLNDIVTNIGALSYARGDNQPSPVFDYRNVDGIEVCYTILTSAATKMNEAVFSLCRERIGGNGMPVDEKRKSYPVTTMIQNINNNGNLYDIQQFHIGFIQSRLWNDNNDPSVIQDDMYLVKKAFLTGMYFNDQGKTETTKRAKYPLACYMESDGSVGYLSYDGEYDNIYDSYRFIALHINNTPKNIKLKPNDVPRTFQGETQIGNFAITGKKERAEELDPKYASEIFTGSAMPVTLSTQMQNARHSIKLLNKLNDWNYIGRYSDDGIMIKQLPKVIGSGGIIETNVTHTGDISAFNTNMFFNRLQPYGKSQDIEDIIYTYNGIEILQNNSINDSDQKETLNLHLNLNHYKQENKNLTNWKLIEFYLLKNDFHYSSDQQLPTPHETKFLNYILPSSQPGEQNVDFSWLHFNGYYSKVEGHIAKTKRKGLSFEVKPGEGNILQRFYSEIPETITITGMKDIGDYIAYGTKLEYDGSKFTYSVLPNPCKEYKPIIYATVDDSNVCPVDQKVELEINSDLKVANDVTVGTQLDDLTKLDEKTLVPAKYVQNIAGSLSDVQQDLTNIKTKFDPVEKLTTAALIPPPDTKPDNKPSLSITDIDLGDVTGIPGHNFYLTPSVTKEIDKDGRETTHYGVEISGKNGDDKKTYGHLHDGGIRATGLAILGTIAGSIASIVTAPFTVLKKLIFTPGFEEYNMDGTYTKYPDSYIESDNYEMSFIGDAFYTLPDNGSFKIKSKNPTTNEEIELLSINNTASNIDENTTSTFNSIILAKHEKQDTDNPEPTEADNIKVATHKYVDNYVANRVFDGTTDKARYSKRQFVVVEENATTLTGIKTILSYPAKDTSDPNKTKCAYGGIRLYNDQIKTGSKGHEIEIRLKNYIRNGREYSEVVMIDHMGQENILYQSWSDVAA